MSFGVVEGLNVLLEEIMANEEQVAILKKGVEEWNQWRKDNLGIIIDLRGANLSGANLRGANLAGAKLNKANLNGANLWETDLRTANFRQARVDGKTSIWGKCLVNKWKREANYTDFAGVSLEMCQIQPGTKQLLEYNIRRSNWELWYKNQCSLQKNLVKWFWSLSDYGLSSKSIIRAFFSYAFVFGVVYYLLGVLDLCIFNSLSPGVVSNLFSIDGIPLDWWQVPLRSIYFSIVTMTTLGFGDMSANAESKFATVGYILLMIQVLLGYVMLGALITRFAILFQAGGPADKFEEFSDEELKEIRKIVAEREKRFRH